MDQAEHTQRLVRILESGADPEAVAKQWAALVLLYGNDPERLALEQAKLFQSTVSEELGSSDEPLNAALDEIFAFMNAAFEVGKLFDSGEYQAALEKAHELVT